MSMRPTFIIGIIGRARHGKDTTGRVMQTVFETCSIKCFLGTVSDQVLRLAQERGLTTTRLRDELSAADLKVMVDLGYKMRKQYEDFWLDRMSIAVNDAEAQVAVVTGLRFLNEVDWVRQQEGVIVRVVRTNADGSLYLSPDRDPNDPMETTQERFKADFELRVGPNGVAWLTAQAEALARHLKERLHPL